MKGIDKPFLILTLALLLVGFFIFISASLGLLARAEINYGLIAAKQLVFGVLLGLLLMFVALKIDYRLWNKYSLYIFVFSIILTAAVFIKPLGFSHNGATRWLDFGKFTFQPAEVLKIGFVIYAASWFAGAKGKIREFKWGLLPLSIFFFISGVILLLQPDTGTFLVIVSAGLAMFLAAGGRWRDLFIVLFAGFVGFSFLAYQRPYLRERILTFVNPAENPLGSGYQLQQSLIAVGSGGIAGRGFGQSLQKFNYLPEPVGDSIFAVFAEEWGIVGGISLIFIFALFTLRGLKIASRAPNLFGGLLVTGIITLIISQSFINIGSMLGIVPLTGMPLVFVSQGGTAMLFALAETGIVLNISKQTRT